MGGISITLMLFLGTLVSVSCQSKTGQEQVAEKVMEKVIKQGSGQDAKVDIQGGNIRIQTPEGTGEISTGGSWPSDLPGDVPRFTLGTIKGVNKGERDGQKSWSVVVDEVKEGALPKYVDEIKAKGWKISSTLTMGKGGTVTASKNNLDLMAMFYDDQKSGLITISQKK